jgi:hypothetical protein
MPPPSWNGNLEKLENSKDNHDHGVQERRSRPDGRSKHGVLAGSGPTQNPAIDRVRKGVIRNLGQTCKGGDGDF